MSNPEPERVPICQLTEWWMKKQRARYDEHLANAVRQIEEPEGPTS